MIGGSGEIRTHGADKDTLVFKTNAISRALPRFHVFWQGLHLRHRLNDFVQRFTLTTHGDERLCDGLEREHRSAVLATVSYE